MRTTLVLDEKLIEEVKSVAGVRTKREAVETAMKDYLRRRKARKLLALEGTVDLSTTVEELLAQRKRDVPPR